MTDLISTADAAAELGISQRRVQALIAAGRLRAVRHPLCPRFLKIRRRDLDAVRERRPGRPKAS